MKRDALLQTSIRFKISAVLGCIHPDINTEFAGVNCPTKTYRHTELEKKHEHASSSQSHLHATNVEDLRVYHVA